MDIDVFVKDVVAALLTDQVDDKTGLAAKVGWAALDEADLPTGPAAFMRLIWRLRKGVGPEVERLASVVKGLASE